MLQDDLQDKLNNLRKIIEENGMKIEAQIVGEYGGKNYINLEDCDKLVITK
jgi:hypothetical protein